MNEPEIHWTLRVLVEGRVQGVMFRESTRREAAAIGVSGWVRNLPDGRVEALFAGTRERCERALAFVRVGPTSASVTHVEIRWEAGTGGVNRGVGFEVR